jgi:hypothetical protein
MTWHLVPSKQKRDVPNVHLVEASPLLPSVDDNQLVVLVHRVVAFFSLVVVVSLPHENVDRDDHVGPASDELYSGAPLVWTSSPNDVQKFKRFGFYVITYELYMFSKQVAALEKWREDIKYFGRPAFSYVGCFEIRCSLAIASNPSAISCKILTEKSTRTLLLNCLLALAPSSVALSTVKTTSSGKKLTNVFEKLTGPVGLGQMLDTALQVCSHLVTGLTDQKHLYF